jgi:hypothetical protein
VGFGLEWFCFESFHKKLLAETWALPGLQILCVEKENFKRNQTVEDKFDITSLCPGNYTRRMTNLGPIPLELGVDMYEMSSTAEKERPMEYELSQCINYMARI